jgi:hypothetical protein
MWSLTRVRGTAVIALLLAMVAGAGCTNPRTAEDGSGQAEVRATVPTTTASGGGKQSAGVLSGFVAFGDFGGGPAQEAVARAMERWAARHRVDALVTTGDNVYNKGEPEKFGAQLDEPYRELRRTRPMWISLGNHDIQGGYGAEMLRHLGLPDLPYSKQLPGVQLLFLDANRPDQAQADWLEARLAGPGPKLRVVVFHQPAWSCSRHDATQAVVDNWVPVLERHQVALVLTAHDHNYQRFTSEQGVSYVVTGGGGRELYELDECPPGTPQRMAAARRNHFTAVEVRDGSLTLTAVAADDTVFDQAVVRP